MVWNERRGGLDYAVKALLQVDRNPFFVDGKGVPFSWRIIL